MTPWNHAPGSGQARLTDAEKARLTVGNQESEGLTIIEWQVVKAAARRYRVPDWTSIADSALSMDENVALMKRHGTAEGAGPTMRELDYATR